MTYSPRLAAMALLRISASRNPSSSCQIWRTGTGETASMAQIKNAKNLTELPMTGDLGIKVFVTVGVLLMAAGAAFALSARMRA